ncbi:MAG: SDR family NAD(P)-dependent oxidoreductase, partial [Candidatus Margulisbacteria bacterium]|nr:SDR family NAD(P)-dependent oxidoreductase [Candidatus Margulisiibacteriota bacterium]
MHLKGKVAIVTGGSRGIGKAIAMNLAGHGANIAILDMMLNETIDELKAKGVKAIGIQTNVTQPDSVNTAIDKVLQELGSIDIVVNNAGITKDNLVMR